MIDYDYYDGTTTGTNYITSRDFYYEECYCPTINHKFDEDIYTPDFDNRSWTFKKYQEEIIRKLNKKNKVDISNKLYYNIIYFKKLFNCRSGYKGLRRLRKEGRL